MPGLAVLRSCTDAQNKLPWVAGYGHGFSLNATPLRGVIERWIGKYEGYWANTLLRVKESAESGVKQQTDSKKRGA